MALFIGIAPSRRCWRMTPTETQHTSRRCPCAIWARQGFLPTQVATQRMTIEMVGGEIAGGSVSDHSGLKEVDLRNVCVHAMMSAKEERECKTRKHHVRGLPCSLRPPPKYQARRRGRPFGAERQAAHPSLFVLLLHLIVPTSPCSQRPQRPPPQP